ncbi:MAG: TA system antitoxin ParD family protein [Candidatus Nanopelagicaceae bacterium]
MGKVVKLNEDFVARVAKEAKSNRRSVPKQIEFYYTIAAAALENPDLPVEWVRDLLISKDSGPGQRVKWIDDALLQIAAKESSKKATAKPKRTRTAGVARSRKKSISR